MKVLVTGATGYVGAAVVRRLEADGHAVRPFSRASGGDIADPASVEEAMDGVDAAVREPHRRPAVVDVEVDARHQVCHHLGHASRQVVVLVV